VIGALIGQFVNFSTVAVVNIGQTSIDLQANVFDPIMPKLLPLLLTIGLYKLLGRGKSPIFLMVAIIVVAIIGTFLGIL
jgi:mannose/fructose/N-acetylgalactosamine-specific phosphotransferase system component IID